MCSLGARKLVDFMILLLQVGQGYLRTERSVRLFEAGDFGGGSRPHYLIDVPYASVPRDRACSELLWRGVRYGSEQAHLLSHHYRNGTVSFSLNSAKAPDRRGRCAYAATVSTPTCACCTVRPCPVEDRLIYAGCCAMGGTVVRRIGS